MNVRAALIMAAMAALAGCARTGAPQKPDPLRNAYDSEVDWNDSQRIIPLNYQQAQGKRVFYEQCVWCHADSTPAGPSNRSNITPTPPLMNDGAVLNGVSDESLRNVIAQGGSAAGKSAMMPPYGKALTAGEISAVIAYARVVAVPPYTPSAPANPAEPSRSGR